MTTAEVREILRMSQLPVSLEKPIGEEEESELGDFVQDDQVESPFDSASLNLRREDIDRALDSLPDRERKVIEPASASRARARERSRRSAAPSASRASGSGRSRTTRSRSSESAPEAQGPCCLAPNYTLTDPAWASASSSGR